MQIHKKVQGSGAKANWGNTASWHTELCDLIFSHVAEIWFSLSIHLSLKYHHPETLYVNIQFVGLQLQSEFGDI